MLPPSLTRRYLCANLLGRLEEGELPYLSCHFIHPFLLTDSLHSLHHLPFFLAARDLEAHMNTLANITTILGSLASSSAPPSPARLFTTTS